MYSSSQQNKDELCVQTKCVFDCAMLICRKKNLLKKIEENVFSYKFIENLNF